jgi:PAS domain S-box-containing protein
VAAAPRVKPSRSRKKPAGVDLPHLNSLEEAVIATDLAGKIVFWNLAAERVYGWKWSEVIGRAVVDLLVPESELPEGTKIMKKLRKGKSWTGPFRLRRKDGSEFVGMVTDQPMRDREGNVIGIIGISRPDWEDCGPRSWNTASSNRSAVPTSS